MFGYVMANPQELRPEQRERYLAVIAAFAGPLGSRIPWPAVWRSITTWSSWPSCCRLSMNRQRSRAPAAA